MQLIGQKRINDFINSTTLEKCPHFIQFVGSRGCGKTLATKKLAEKLGVQMVKFEHNVQSVRDMITTAYSVKQPHIYWCETADKMRAEASNALLKITEEPPSHSYIILHSQAPLLETLKSRAQVFNFEPYSSEEFSEFCKLKNLTLPSQFEVLSACCNSLSEFEYYTITGRFEKALELSEMVLQYIHEVSVVNAFKILKRLAFKKEDEEGIEPEFFLTVLINLYIHKQGKVKGGKAIVESSLKALSYLKNDVFSKQSIMNSWVLEIVEGIDKECL